MHFDSLLLNAQPPTNYLGRDRLFTQPDRINKPPPERITATNSPYALAAQLQGLPPTQRLSADVPPLPSRNQALVSNASSFPAAAADMLVNPMAQLSVETQEILEGDGGAWPPIAANDTSQTAKHPGGKPSSYHRSQSQEYPMFENTRSHASPGITTLPIQPKPGFIQSTTAKPQSSIPPCQLLRGRTVATHLLPSGLAVNGLGISQATSAGLPPSQLAGQQHRVLASGYAQRRSSSSLGFDASSQSKQSSQVMETGSRHGF